MASGTDIPYAWEDVGEQRTINQILPTEYFILKGGRHALKFLNQARQPAASACLVS